MVLTVGIAVGNQIAATDVCSLKTLSRGRTVSLRGTAQFDRDGTIISGDRTCPVARDSDFVVPVSVVLEISSFASLDVRSRFERISSKRTPCTLLQVGVTGRLAGPSSFKIVKNETCEVIHGNSFGVDGLYRWKLDGTLLFAVEEFGPLGECKVQWSEAK